MMESADPKKPLDSSREMLANACFWTTRNGGEQAEHAPGRPAPAVLENHADSAKKTAPQNTTKPLQTLTLHPCESGLHHQTKPDNRPPFQAARPCQRPDDCGATWKQRIPPATLSPWFSNVPPRAITARTAPARLWGILSAISHGRYRLFCISIFCISMRRR